MLHYQFIRSCVFQQQKMGVQRRALLQFTISENFISQFIIEGLHWLVLYETYCLTKSHDWRHGEEWGWTKRGGMWGRGELSITIESNTTNFN